MTSYQKLLVENKILWAELEATLRNYYHGCNEPEKNIQKFLKDLQWAIRRAQHEDKD